MFIDVHVLFELWLGNLWLLCEWVNYPKKITYGLWNGRTTGRAGAVKRTGVRWIENKQTQLSSKDVRTRRQRNNLWITLRVRLTGFCGASTRVFLLLFPRNLMRGDRGLAAKYKYIAKWRVLDQTVAKVRVSDEFRDLPPEPSPARTAGSPQISILIKPTFCSAASIPPLAIAVLQRASSFSAFPHVIVARRRSGLLSIRMLNANYIINKSQMTKDQT